MVLRAHLRAHMRNKKLKCSASHLAMPCLKQNSPKLFCVGRCRPSLHLQMGKDKDFKGDEIHPGSHLDTVLRIIVVYLIFQIPKSKDGWLGCCLYLYSSSTFHYPRRVRLDSPCISLVPGMGTREIEWSITLSSAMSKPTMSLCQSFPGETEAEDTAAGMEWAMSPCCRVLG